MGDFRVYPRYFFDSTDRAAYAGRKPIGPGRRLAAVVLATAALTLTLVFAPTVAAAEAPTALVDDLTQNGVYVSRVRTDVDEEALAAAIQQVRFDGLRIVAVAPIDPQPDGEAFARRVQEVVDADAAMVFLADGTLETFVIDDLAAARIRATDKARAVADPARAVLIFADELTSSRTQGRPAIIGQLIMAVILMALGIGLIVGIEQSISADRRRKTETNVTS